MAAIARENQKSVGSVLEARTLVPPAN